MEEFEISKDAVSFGFNYFPMVPDTKINRYFDISNTPHVILSSREEESIALGCGLILAGEKPMVIVQSSGLINSSNTIGTFAVSYRIPLIILCSLRGDSSDINQSHSPVFRTVKKCMYSLGCKLYNLCGSDEIALPDILRNAQSDADQYSVPVIVFF